MAKVLICKKCNEEFWGNLSVNSLCSCGHNLIKNKNELLQEKVDQMYWDYDRLSRSGQDTLDDIAKLVGFEDKLSDAEVKKKLENNNG